MATYLKRHIERSQDLPANLHRLFRLIKDLDEKVRWTRAVVHGVAFVAETYTSVKLF